MPEQSNQEYGKGYFLIANPVFARPKLFPYRGSFMQPRR